MATTNVAALDFASIWIKPVRRISVTVALVCKAIVGAVNGGLMASRTSIPSRKIETNLSALQEAGMPPG
jgi:hypothetical protein